MTRYMGEGNAVTDDRGHLEHTIRLRAQADAYDAQDATWECKHGNLPGRPQRVQRCDCYQHRTRRARSAA